MRGVVAGASTVAVVAALLGAACPSSARPKPSAAPSAAPAPDPAKEARERFSLGVAFAKKGDWKNAYDAFLGAWKLKQHPQVALNLARAEIEIGKPVDAAEHLRYCLDNIPASDPDAKLAREWLVEAQKGAAKLAVKVSVAGARVLVDERFVGESPLSQAVPIDPGNHVVEASLGARRVRRQVVAESGAEVLVDMVLPPPPPPAAAPVDRPFVSRTTLLIAGTGGTALGLLAGITFGALAVERESQRNECLRGGGPACWDRIEAERVTHARVSLASFLGGGLLGALTGSYWLLGDTKPKTGVVVAPAVSNTFAGIALTGDF